MLQTQENGLKLHFGSDLGSLGPNSGRPIVFIKNILSPLVQIWASHFFSWVLPLLDVKHCRKLSLCAISRKTYDPNSIK